LALDVIESSATPMEGHLNADVLPARPTGLSITLIGVRALSTGDTSEVQVSVCDFLLNAVTDFVGDVTLRVVDTSGATPTTLLTLNHRYSAADEGLHTFLVTWPGPHASLQLSAASAGLPDASFPGITTS
jgi:hypothetical protein